MSGRGLANASVFVLGLILIGGGAWGIFQGSQFIQVEQGWSSVISGSVAVTGGVLTLSVGFVLRRLDAVHRALLGLPGREGLATLHASEPVQTGLSQEPPPFAGEPAVRGAVPGAEFDAPGLQGAAAINLPHPAHEDHRTHSAERPISYQDDLAADTASHAAPEAVYAVEQGPADDMARAAGVSDEPELDAAIEQLLAEERAKGSPGAPPSLVSDEGSAEFHQSGVASGGEDVPEQPEGRGSGWRGLFSRKDRGAIASAAADRMHVEPPPHRQSEHASAAPEHESLPEASDAPSAHPGPIPRTGDDWFDRALSGLDEAEPGRMAAPPALDDSTNRANARQDLSESRLEIHPRAAEETSQGAPSPPNPAVIGRYTSGNTTYVMFADGSIEAETPTGILRFASLADLKVYVEGGQ